MPMHADEMDVDVAVARRLVADQFPRWRDLPVQRLDTPATVNAIFRIGDALTARFPLRAEDRVKVGARLRAEESAARELAAVSSVPTPGPVALGAPAPAYPLPWSVQTWLPGTDA